MIKLAVLGATGRMGSRTIAMLAGDERFELTAALTQPGDPRVGESVECPGRSVPIAATTDAPFDVLIDFSLPEGTMAWLDACVERSAAMVIGSTGHSEAQLARIDAAGERIPVLRAANFSLGVNLLSALCAEAAARLGNDWDVEIIEQHHGQKVDAPSGTALALANQIAQARGPGRPTEIVVGRSGHTPARPAGQIGIHAVRLGSLVSVHDVHFGSSEETVTLRHAAHSRDVFVRGALETAAWIARRPPGHYSMADVLSLRKTPS